MIRRCLTISFTFIYITLLVASCSRGTPLPEPVATSTLSLTAVPSTTIESDPTPQINKDPLTTQNSKTITVASHGFTEQLVLGKILKILLEEAGFVVIDKTGLGGADVLREAHLNGDIDIYMEYTGTALTGYHNIPPSALPKDKDSTFELAKALDEPNGLVWLGRTEFNNTYAMIVRKDTKDRLGLDRLETIDDFAEHIEKFNVCIHAVFGAREEDGLPGLEKHYEFQVPKEQLKILDRSQLYIELTDNESSNCDVIEGFSTDGQISEEALQVLTDSRGFFPFYNVSPVVREAILAENPEIDSLLSGVLPLLTDSKMSELNARVDINGELPENVARSFLDESDIKTITVASHGFTEQLVLGQILKILLEEAGFVVIDKTGLGGADVLREAHLNGDIDIYMEYTGTALTGYHNIPPSALPKDKDSTFELAKALDEPNGLIWLGRTEFNNTYAMIVRKDTKDRLGLDRLETIDDFAEHVERFNVCIHAVFGAREEDGLPGLEKHYEFQVPKDQLKILDRSQLYVELTDNETSNCDIIEGFSTDGQISEEALQVLTDSRGFFPFYNVSPVVREAILAENPEIESLLSGVLPLLTNAKMSELNARVDINGELPENVARSFLCALNIASNCVLIQQSRPFEITSAFLNNNCQNLLVNGGFESQEGWEIMQSEIEAMYTNTPVFTGLKSMKLGGLNGEIINSDSIVYQQVDLPEDAQSINLSFRYNPKSSGVREHMVSANENELIGIMINDDIRIEFNDISSPGTTDNENWLTGNFDLDAFAGTTLRILFIARNDGIEPHVSMYVDDVVLDVCTE